MQQVIFNTYNDLSTVTFKDRVSAAKQEHEKETKNGKLMGKGANGEEDQTKGYQSTLISRQKPYYNTPGIYGIQPPIYFISCTMHYHFCQNFSSI